MPSRPGSRRKARFLARRAERTSPARLTRLLDRYELMRGNRDLVTKWLFREKFIFDEDRKAIRRGLDQTHDFGRTLSYYSSIYELFRSFAPGNTLKGKTFLHVGSSVGLFTEFLQSTGAKAIPLDPNFVANRLSRKIGNKRTVRGAAQHLPFRGDSVDFVLSDHFLMARYPSLRHLEMRVLREVHRILRPNGLFVISLFELPEPEVRRLVTNHGFSVERVYDEFEDAPSPIMVLKKNPVVEPFHSSKPLF